MRSEKPKVSVIIPVYNMEHWLRACLDSVACQTLREIEIICINDCSTDGSLAILQEYAGRDARFRLIDKAKNGGTLLARRDGVMAARAEYLIFVDPDDCLAEDACRVAYKEIRRHRSDILQFSCAVEYLVKCERAEGFLETYLRPEDKTSDRREMQDGMFRNRSISTNPFGKIYLTSKYRLAYQHMPELYGIMGEDVFQHFFLSFFCDSYTGVTTQPLYLYRWGQGITNDEIMPLSRYEQYCRMAVFYEEMLRFARSREDRAFAEDCAVMAGFRLCEECSRAWAEQISEEDREEAFRLFWRYWRSFPELARAFEHAAHRSLEQTFDACFGIPKYVRPSEKWSDTGSRPLISVIIPVFNVETWLRACLDSVVRQTLREIEIICINDGSTDGSLPILEEYRETDPRITVISRENGGASAARNAGLGCAGGEYVLFLDGDDYIDPDTLEKTLRLARDSDADVVHFGCRPFYESEELRSSHPFDDYFDMNGFSGLFSGVDYLRTSKDSRAYNATVFKLWRRAMLSEKGISFREGIIHEDELFVFLGFLAADRVLVVPDVFYHYRIRPTSVSTARKSHKDVIGYFTAAAEILKLGLQGDVTAEEDREIRRAWAELTACAVRDYDPLPAWEKEMVVFGDTVEDTLFQQVVVSGCELNRTVRELIRVTNDHDCIQASVSFRAGRAITWLPRKMRDAVRFCRQFGLRRTVRRFIEVISGKA